MSATSPYPNRTSQNPKEKVSHFKRSTSTRPTTNKINLNTKLHWKPNRGLSRTRQKHFYRRETEIIEYNKRIIKCNLKIYL